MNLNELSPALRGFIQLAARGHLPFASSSEVAAGRLAKAVLDLSAKLDDFNFAGFVRFAEWSRGNGRTAAEMLDAAAAETKSDAH